MNRCPMKYVTSESLWFIEAHYFTSRYGLPGGKGWEAESSLMLDAFSVIDQMMSELKKEEGENGRR